MTAKTSKTSNDAMLQKLDAIVEQLKRPPIPPRDVLWTNQDIADWLQLSLNTVTARVLNRPRIEPPGISRTFATVRHRRARGQTLVCCRCDPVGPTTSAHRAQIPSGAHPSVQP